MFIEEGDFSYIDDMNASYSGSNNFFRFSEPSENSTYTILVRALNSDVKSDFTKMKFTTGTLPEKFEIKNTYKEISSGYEFNLTWEEVSGANYYEIYRIKSPKQWDSFIWEQYSGFLYATTKDCSYIDKISEKGNWYYWIVHAVNDYGFTVCTNGSRFNY